MKTTIDLPESLVKQVKLHALRDGRKLKDAVADLLRIGLKARRKKAEPPAPVIGTDKQTGLPVILGGKRPSAGEELTPERIADILLAQEVEWHHAAGG